MRRRKLLVALAGLAVAVASGLVVLWPSSRTTQDNSDRIKIGMTRAEVQAILGPPGDYRTNAPPPRGWPSGSGLRSTWEADDGTIQVVFNSDDCVASCSFFPNAGERRDGFNQVLGWVNRQWHRWFP
jgi:hypothetical protein